MNPAEPSQLLNATIEAIDYPDSDAARECGQRLAERTLDGSLGLLDELSNWAAGVQGRCPPEPFPASRLVLFAADHGLATDQVSADPDEEKPVGTADRLAVLGRGDGVLNLLADQAGVPVRLVDLGVDADTDPALADWKVRRSSGRIDRADALTRAEAEAAIEAGIALADREIDSGADLLIAADLGLGNRVAAAAVVSVLTDTEPIKVVTSSIGPDSRLDDRRWISDCAVIRDARRRAWPHRVEVVELLAIAGGADLAAITGFVLQAARRRTPVLLDGLVVSAAALVAQLACPRVVRWLQAAHLSPEPAHPLALQRLGLSPILQFGISYGQGSGALLALPVLRAAARLTEAR